MKNTKKAIKINFKKLTNLIKYSKKKQLIQLK